MTRDLLSLRTGAVHGAVRLNGQAAAWDGIADEVFAAYRQEVGDLVAAQALIERGWSNGQTLYLGPVRR